MKPLKILSLPVDFGGCGSYRIRQPFDMINRYTEHEAHVVDLEKLNKPEYLRGVTMAVEQADIVVFRSTGDTQNSAIDMIRKRPEFKAKKLVLDIDDNPEMVNPYSAHYADFGIEEYFDRNQGKWLWKDGEDGFDLKRNRAKMHQMIRDLKDVDMVTVTTKRLAQYAKQYNKKVAILPNCIDFKKWWPIKQEKRNVRIALQGGYSHYADWELIRKPLSKILREHDVTLLMIGYDYSGIVDEDVRHKVEIHDWVDFSAHSYRMMCLNIDIAVIPLDEDGFNQNKSSIKLYEFGAMGVPCVVSNVLPYSEDLTKGNIAVKFKTDRELYEGLTSLVASPKHRETIAFNCNAYVHKNYDAKSNVNKWIDAYTSLLT